MGIVLPYIIAASNKTTTNNLNTKKMKKLPQNLINRISKCKKKYGIDITIELSILAYEMYIDTNCGSSTIGCHFFNPKNKRESNLFGDIAIDCGNFIINN